MFIVSLNIELNVTLLITMAAINSPVERITRQRNHEIKAGIDLVIKTKQRSIFGGGSDFVIACFRGRSVSHSGFAVTHNKTINFVNARLLNFKSIIIRLAGETSRARRVILNAERARAYISAVTHTATE